MERLTRFYSRADPSYILDEITTALETLLVPHKINRNAWKVILKGKKKMKTII